MMRRRLLCAAAASAITPVHATPAAFGTGAWRRLIADHAGHDTIFHFWGLTCGPCLAELPEWGKLIQERPRTDLVVIAADPIPQSPEQCAATLERAGLGSVQSWIFDGRFSARLYFEVDRTWQGELPRTMLSPKNGDPESFLGSADFPRVRAWLDRPHT